MISGTTTTIRRVFPLRLGDGNEKSDGWFPWRFFSRLAKMVHDATKGGEGGRRGTFFCFKVQVSKSQIEELPNLFFVFFGSYSGMYTKKARHKTQIVGI